VCFSCTVPSQECNRDDHFPDIIGFDKSLQTVICQPLKHGWQPMTARDGGNCGPLWTEYEEIKMVRNLHAVNDNWYCR